MNQSGQIEPITGTEGPQMKSNNPLTNSHVNTKKDTWRAKNTIVPVLSLCHYQNACVSLSNSHTNTSKGHSPKPKEKNTALFVLPFLPETTLTPLNASLPGLGLLTPTNSRNLPNGVTSDATKWLQIRTRGRLWWKCKKRLFTKHLRSQGISSGAGTYYQTR